MYYLNYLIDMCLFREKHLTGEKYNLQHNNENAWLNEGKGGCWNPNFYVKSWFDIPFLPTFAFQEFDFYFMKQQIVFFFQRTV